MPVRPLVPLRRAAAKVAGAVLADATEAAGRAAAGALAREAGPLATKALEGLGKLAARLNAMPGRPPSSPTRVARTAYDAMSPELRAIIDAHRRR